MRKMRRNKWRKRRMRKMRRNKWRKSTKWRQWNKMKIRK
jgi:hypothetical protein